MGVIYPRRGDRGSDLVSDNNVLFVPKREWLRGYLAKRIYPFDVQIAVDFNLFTTIQQSADTGLGVIEEFTLSQLKKVIPLVPVIPLGDRETLNHDVSTY